MASSDPTAPLALPAKTEEKRTAGAAPEAEGLTIGEAVARFEVGANTLRRWLQRGELPGAVKVPSTKGDTYRIPLAALEARGLRPRGGVEAAATEAAAALKQAETELRKARAQLEQAEAKTREAQSDALAARTRSAELGVQLDAEREKLRLVTEAQSDLRRALLILESEQQKRTRAEQEAARSFFGWLRHRKTAKSGGPEKEAEPPPNRVETDPPPSEPFA